MKVCFKVMGKPQGKARPRLSRHGVYTPQSTVQYENKIRAAYKEAAPKEFFCIDVAVEVHAYFPIPKSWSAEKQVHAMVGDFAPGKPDVDNILKIVMDGLNGYAYSDDALVTKAVCHKRYAARGEEGRIEVTVSGS